MDITIIGLPQSGKTTVFNAVTKGAIKIASYANAPNVGVVKVPDSRLIELGKIYNPKYVIQAEITYTDLPSDYEKSTNGILPRTYLNNLQKADALLLVSRGFDDDSIVHSKGTIDVFRDIRTLLDELVLVDLEILERRLVKLDENKKGINTEERQKILWETDFLMKLSKSLEDGINISDQNYSEQETRLLSGFQFLTAKPLIIVANIGEEQIQLINTMQTDLNDKFRANRINTSVICGSLEMDLIQLDLQEQIEFRKSLQLDSQSGLQRMIKLSYDALDLISFLTVGDDEVRAWPITKGTIAVKAAGKIHSDLEKGFIRGEVISYDNLMKSGSLSVGRTKGLLRQEGKEYVLEDGDIMHVLFNN